MTCLPVTRASVALLRCCRPLLELMTMSMGRSIGARLGAGGGAAATAWPRAKRPARAQRLDQIGGIAGAAVQSRGTVAPAGDEPAGRDDRAGGLHAAPEVGRIDAPAQDHLVHG